MKVLMQSRENFYKLKGGDTVQLLKTKEQLEKLGVNIKISLELEPDLSAYDIVHLSNITRIHETYIQMKNAKRQRKPVVLSTIFWPMEDFEQNGQIGLRKLINSHLKIDSIERIKAAARFIKDKSARNKAARSLLTVGYSAMQCYVVNNASLFLPNAEMEMDKFCEQFGIQKKNYVVVPNAIDDDIAREKYNEPVLEEFEKYKDAVICVGRIEPRKNQLALVKALDGSGLKLVLAGGVSPNQKKYFEEVNKYIKANKNFYYIPGISNDKLYMLYRICRVSALPSWLDTPGLASLEAAAMGCNLAVSSRGSVTEYFLDYACYCEPDDISSIRRAVFTAYKKDKNQNLVNHVFKNYTWKEAAKATLYGYELVLKSNS